MRTRNLSRAAAFSVALLAYPGVCLQALAADDLSFFGWAAAAQTSLSTDSDSLRQSPVIYPLTPSSGPAGAHGHEAIVRETLEAPGFNTTYLELDANGNRFWIASRIIDVRVGNKVRFAPDNVVAMEHFESKALHKTFEKIYFVPQLTIVD